MIVVLIMTVTVTVITARKAMGVSQSAPIRCDLRTEGRGVLEYIHFLRRHAISEIRSSLTSTTSLWIGYSLGSKKLKAFVRKLLS